LKLSVNKKIAREPGWKRRTPSSPVPGTDRELLQATEIACELTACIIPNFGKVLQVGVILIPSPFFAVFY
jgi:hypothetical protein